MAAPDGRTPDPEAGETAVPDRVLPLARAKTRAIPVSVSGIFILASHCPTPSAAPTASTASRTIASAKCVYLRVVCGSLCPSSRPMTRTLSPC